MTQILFKKLLSNAQVPTKGTPDSAAFDLYVAAVEYKPLLNMLIADTGIATAFPAGHVLHFYGRSGHASKHRIRLANSVAVIDADYRGSLKILLTSDNPGQDWVKQIQIGDRIAQAMLLKLPDTEWVEVEDLPPSVRGEGGFGSTGT